MTNPIVDKTIILGVTGSIAAYKAADLASKLTQSGAKVEVILTQAAQEFITPLTFQSVTGRRAFTDEDLWGREGHVTHIALGHGADLLVIAPASANTIARLAHGLGDNLLTIAALAAHCPILLAPAMDAGMFSHPATTSNVETLLKRGASILGPAEGHLASGLVGVGRMVEPAHILGKIRWICAQNGPLIGKKVVVTAGGTQEPIDPVRFITNRSSGRQGYAIAQAALDAGADVTLITTTTQLEIPYGCHAILVHTAEEMLNTVMQETIRADVLIMAAAVADFRPASVAIHKIKKSQGLPQLILENTADITLAVADRRKSTGFPLKVIGFAAESTDLLTHAKAKMTTKMLDLIVANDISQPDAGFEVQTNRVTLLFPDGRQDSLPLELKSSVAEHIIAQVVKWF